MRSLDFTPSPLVDELTETDILTLTYLLFTPLISPYTHISALPIGRINDPMKNIVENIVSGMKTVTTKIPRGWRNIQAVHLKTIDSIALPIYNSLPPHATLLSETGVGPSAKKVRLEAPGESDGEMKDLQTQAMSSSKKVSQKEFDGKTTKPISATKRAKVRTKTSAKKIKGSTVLSSKYEKLLKRPKTVKSA